jgi:hypothetical protein
MSVALRRLVMLAMLVLALTAAPASAAITSSNVTSPTGTSYQVYDQDSPNTIAVAGTTNSSSPSTDQVDLQCFYGPGSASHQAIATGVSLNPADGSFSIPNASLTAVQFHACTLRAVPAGTIPGSLTSFTGPLLATGHRQSTMVAGGPNDGTTKDFYLYGQQLTAADDYDSYGVCGLCDSDLFDSNFVQTAYTFFGNDWFGTGDHTSSSGSTRSEVRVDGADAYSPGSAYHVNSGASSGFPALTYGYSVDPSNGNLTITESDPLVRCPSPTYPPNNTTCPMFISTGVTVHRTITQESDGHLVFITDRYVSTDGQQHNLDLLPENDQSFFQHGLTVAYKFPGESSFSTHAAGDLVSFPASGPAAIYVNVQGSPDGTQSTGQGAIVFDRPASPATFTYVYGSASLFHLQQTGLVTGTCSPSFSFAYADAYLAADVASLAQAALARFAGSPATVCSPVPPSGSGGSPATPRKKCKKKKKHSAAKSKKCRKKRH